MKIKEGFMLYPIMGRTMAISTGEMESKFPGFIKMNDSAVDIWHWIEEGCSMEDLYSKYFDKYDCENREQACSDVDSVIAVLRENGIIEED